MKALYTNVLAVGLCVLCASCEKPDPNDQVDEGTIKDQTYTSDEIGWRIVIPNSWTIIEREETDKLQSKGNRAIAESVGQEFDTSELRNLVGFQKDQFNLFQSTSEPFEEEYEGEWEENNSALRDVIIQTYRDQGMEVEASEIETEDIGGLEFHKYSIRILSPDGDVILNQILYSRLINGFDFGVNINYNNEEFGHEMLEAWRSSGFDL